MGESLFFPEKPDKTIDLEAYEKKINDEVNKMYDYLHSNVGESKVKTKLHDQLIWLQYQMKYFHCFQDFSLFEENFNRVVENFNHNLSISEDQSFRIISTKSI